MALTFRNPVVSYLNCLGYLNAETYTPRVVKYACLKDILRYVLLLPLFVSFFIILQRTRRGQRSPHLLFLGFVSIANVPNTFSVGIGHLNNRNLTFRCVPNKDGILVFLESVTDSEVVSSVTSPKTRNGYYAEIRQTGLIKMRSKSHNLRLRNSPLEME